MFFDNSHVSQDMWISLTFQVEKLWRHTISLRWRLFDIIRPTRKKPQSRKHGARDKQGSGEAEDRGTGDGEGKWTGVILINFSTWRRCFTERYFRRLFNFWGFLGGSKPKWNWKPNRKAIKSMSERRNVVLPTGFGKSLIFQMFACVKKFKEEQGCVLVVSPLKSIIIDQIEEEIVLNWGRWTRKPCDTRTTGFALSPLALAEAVLSKEFRARLKERSLVHFVVVDESHTIETWTGER